jgi:hypothetical protein
MSKAPEWLPPAAIGCAAGLLIYLALGDRVIPTADEGIYLQGGANVLHGAVPYRDFFTLTGPGSFWLVAAIFRVAGVTLRSARMLVTLDLSILTALTCWIVSRFACRASAVGASVLLLALCVSSPGNVVINHRWDSSAAALVAIAAGLYAIQTGRRAAGLVAGAAAAMAAWITPSTALVAVVIAARIACERKTRPLGAPFAAGACAGLLLPAALLAWQHALLPMLRSLYWTGTHYSGANRIAYGAVFGGTAGLLGGAHGGQLPVRILLLMPFLLPALLPPLAVLAWLPVLRTPRRTEAYLLFCGLALALSAYPRWDLLHLLYISPLFLALAAVRMERAPFPLARLAVLLLLLIPAAAMCSHSLIGEGGELEMATPAGRLHVARADAPAIRMCLTHIHPADTLFVFPYEPFFYFLTGGQNPTRYLWLQPGMMSGEDERAALSELAAAPPQWILYRDIAPADYLRIWPGSDPARLRMTSIEEWIASNYRPLASAAAPDGVRRLLERRGGGGERFSLPAVERGSPRYDRYQSAQ